jgi:hypothetical protein
MKYCSYHLYTIGSMCRRYMHPWSRTRRQSGNSPYEDQTKNKVHQEPVRHISHLHLHKQKKLFPIWRTSAASLIQSPIVDAIDAEPLCLEGQNKIHRSQFWQVSLRTRAYSKSPEQSYKENATRHSSVFELFFDFNGTLNDSGERSLDINGDSSSNA